MICTTKLMFLCILHNTICYGWKLKSGDLNQVEELKTKCTLQCPFQKQTPDLYTEDITCEIDCKIEHCVKGCHFLEAALETDCETLCNVTHNAVDSSKLFCFIGCKQALMAYFDSIRNEISNLNAPALVEHTLSATSLNLDWNEPNLVNETYMLQCCLVDSSNDWEFCQNQTWISPNLVNVQTLQPYTKYQFRVAIRLTPGDWYDVFSAPSSIIATLPGGLPTSSPKILTATSVSSSIISVIWQEGPFTNGPITSYILQINELPMGYAGVKDITAAKKIHSCMLRNLEPSTMYSIAISARNSVGLGPPASIVMKTKPILNKINETVNLMVTTEHSVYSISWDVQEEPVLMYNTTHEIKGIALHVHRELLFISDSSGSIIVSSSKGLLTPQELPIPSSPKPSALTIDWLSDYLYILQEILHPSGSIVYQVARCNLDGTNLIVVISGFIMKPHHIEVDPYNGYLFWVVRGVGLYRLDLIDISKSINRNVSPELILDDANLGAFLVNYDHLRIVIHSQNKIMSISLDGQDVGTFCSKSHEPRFQNVVSLAMSSDSLFSTDGEHVYQEMCDAQNKSFAVNVTNKLLMENCKAVVANTIYGQPFPVPLNPPTDFQAIFGHNIAKVTWEKPYHLAGQGDGTWSSWSYRLIVETKNGTQLDDIKDIKVNQYTVTNLKPGTEYVLKVAAYTFSGEGPWSENFRGKTLHRDVSLLWSSNKGLLLSDITGYRVTKIEPDNYVEADTQFSIADIDWYKDQVFVSTNKQQVFWYNLTSNTYGWIQDINGADCLSVEWLAEKIYWGNKKNKMIFRSDLNGNKQEILPIVVAAESLFLDSYAAYIYWSTKNSVEGACLDGTRREVFYASKNGFKSQIMGLALDIDGSELYWIEKHSTHPRQSALMITNVKNKSREHPAGDPYIDKHSLINQDVGGGLCYIDQHLIWVRNDDKNAMISGLNGTTTAFIHSDSLSNLITCTAVDPFIRTMSPVQKNNSEKINVIPGAVLKSSIGIEGSSSLFNITWSPVTNVNYGNVYYRLKVKIDDFDTKVDTSNSFVTINHTKAYVPLNIVLQSYTYWSISNPVRITLRSPSSTPSSPLNPRVFVMHKKKPMSPQKEVSILLRWSPPLEPNGIIQRYELSCWVTHDHINSSGTTCSSSQISAKTLEFTLQNLPSNKIHNFRVRACNDFGCGDWSRVVQTDFEEEIPIPKLLIITNEGLTKMDFDRKSFSIAIPETKNVRDVFYEASRSIIFWIEKNNLYQSYLNLHLTNIKKLTDVKNDGICLSYDWIGRNLYWVDVNASGSTINVLDLNRNEEDRLVSSLLHRPRIIKTLLSSPMDSLLFWVELKQTESTSSTLMKCSMDGTNVTEFFTKEISFSKNDVSSFALPINEEQEVLCNCSATNVGTSISLYPASQNHYKLLWFDIMSGFIISSDLEGCGCRKIVNVHRSSPDGFPKSITADFKKLYWLDEDETTIYSASIDDPAASVENISASGIIRLRKIFAFGSQLQFFPETRCLWPHLKPDVIQVVKSSSDSMVVRLPDVRNESKCKNISMATVEFTVYYSVVNEDGSSNCTSNLKSCSQVVTYDKIKKVNKLKPYTRYVFIVGVSNYYSQLEGIDPVISEPTIYRTAPGVPSLPRNVTGIAYTPNAILVKWLPPENFNAEAVGYSLLLHTKYENGTEQTQEHVPPRRNDTSVLLENLRPAQTYIIRVKVFPVVNGQSMPSIGYRYCENVTVTTYPEPANFTLAKATSSSLNLSLPVECEKFPFEVEMYNNVTKKWDIVSSNGSRFAAVNKLHPLTRYTFRVRIRYPQTQTPFLWSTNGFTFETLGDKPNQPGIPTVSYVKEDSYKVAWEPSENYGRDVLIYELERIQLDLEQQQGANEFLNTFSSNWTVLYNGTDNHWIMPNLKDNIVYKFRVRARNEYGFSNYSEISDEFKMPSQNNVAIASWSILPAFCAIVIVVFTIVMYVFFRRSCRKKRKFVKHEILAINRNQDVELVNLPEIPAGAKVIKTNLLYGSQMYENHINEDFTQIPRIMRDQITLAKFLGSGAFGEVYEGNVKNLLYANVETKVAIKALRKNATEQEKQEFLKEALLMSNFKHRHILQLLGICIDNNPHFIIMELMEAGDLLSYLRSNRSSLIGNSSLTYLDLLGICCDVVSGCCYLEELHFVHRDLACRNCLVSSRDPALRIVKIGDFGLARDIYKNDYYRKKGEGLLPVRWMAPESLVDGVFTRHSDVWSFGVLLWEVMSLGQQPYQARSNVEVLQYVRAGGRLNRPSNCPPRLYKLMEKCWNFKPKERPTFAYCLSELDDLKSHCDFDTSHIDYTHCLPIPNNAVTLPSRPG